jgi:hypothetical protein
LNIVCFCAEMFYLRGGALGEAFAFLSFRNALMIVLLSKCAFAVDMLSTHSALFSLSVCLPCFNAYAFNSIPTNLYWALFLSNLKKYHCIESFASPLAAFKRPSTGMDISFNRPP